MTAGVYMLVPEKGMNAPKALDMNMTSAIVTFNSDGCADSTRLWDGRLGAAIGENTPTHGMWNRVRGGFEADLMYFTLNDNGSLERISKATLTVKLDPDLMYGTGMLP